jgi:hypothetical protein
MGMALRTGFYFLKRENILAATDENGDAKLEFFVQEYEFQLAKFPRA